MSYETKYFAMKELDIMDSRNATMQNFTDVMRVLESGCYPIKETITSSVNFTKAGEALAAWGRVTKIQIEI